MIGVLLGVVGAIVLALRLGLWNFLGPLSTQHPHLAGLPLPSVVPLLEHLRAFAGALPLDSSGAPYSSRSLLLGRGPLSSSPAAAA